MNESKFFFSDLIIVAVACSIGAVQFEVAGQFWAAYGLALGFTAGLIVHRFGGTYRFVENDLDLTGVDFNTTATHGARAA